jgi:catechol 2,3-dioxygenase-like lactoylglutathione lyase family enzyme
MPALSIDHAAFPCFDVAATHRFYTETLGCPLVFALSAPSEAWKVEEFLLLTYGLPDGSAIDFFSFDGIARPDDGLPKDIRHIGLAVPKRENVLAFKERFERASISCWVETHGADDLHVYGIDPNGLVIEILAAEDGSRARAKDTEGALKTLERWFARHHG